MASKEPPARKKNAPSRVARGASKTSKPICREVQHHNSAGDKGASEAEPGGKLRRALSRDGQTALTLNLLRIAPRSTFELRRVGMASPAARIQDQEALGCVIDSARNVAVDPDGFSHYGVALYMLLAEPEVMEVAE